MKQGLIKHISEIFQTLQISSSFEVYECAVDELPAWTALIILTNEFLICCEPIADKQKLEKFIGKELNQIESYHFWSEGDVMIQQIELEQPKVKAEKKIDYLKTNTRLPAWLDDYIFNVLNAQYAPDFQKFDKNLELSIEDNLKYLGTYFPRSYSESFCIFDNLFQNKIICKEYSKKESLNILSVGCGTGGDLIGLTTAINKYFPLVKKLNVYAIDGNSDAIVLLSKIIEKNEQVSGVKIDLHPIDFVFKDFESANIVDLKLDDTRFDFLLSFKMIGEVIATGKGRCDNSYSSFVEMFVPLLTDSGICVILDVTTKQEHNGLYNPIMMNKQVNRSLLQNGTLQTLLPLSCRFYGSNCYEGCFTQKTFSVSHSKHNSDKSKVTYRVIANQDFRNKIANINEEANYLIYKDKCCNYTQRNIEFCDAFLLNNTEMKVL